jgi:hypothetical protein
VGDAPFARLKEEETKMNNGRSGPKKGRADKERALRLLWAAESFELRVIREAKAAGDEAKVQEARLRLRLVRRGIKGYEAACPDVAALWERYRRGLGRRVGDRRRVRRRRPRSEP